MRDAEPSDFDALLALNAASVHFLSPLDRPALEALVAQSALCRVVDVRHRPVAFVLALREGAPYASGNYRWFDERHASFLYVDRIVVAGAYRRNGLGTLLYRDVFRSAVDARIPLVTCEFDVDPPNAASARFHAGFGFREVGTRLAGSGRKRVSLQAADALGGACAGPARVV